MENQTSTPLIPALSVYKASAGSGKTFRLTVEYIKLLIRNPENYRHILAVTFTNKATEEMKHRILSKLYALSKGYSKDSADYMDEITRDLNVSEDYVARRAQVALMNLVNNYSYFRVQTIDTFFQGVLRNMAHELDLNSNIRVSLQDEQIEQDAVDDLIEGLTHNSKELAWIMEFIRENMSNDKNWNVIKELKEFGQNIYKDFYKSNEKAINERLHKKDFYNNYVKSLKKMMRDAEEELKGYADRFFAIVDEEGLDASDFNRKTSGPFGYFLKLRNGEFRKKNLLNKYVNDALDDPDNWVKKADRDNSVRAYVVARNRLAPLMEECEGRRPKLASDYFSAQLTLSNLNQLRLLNSIDNKAKENKKQQNLFMLSDTQTLLSEMIDDSTTPFIYEKVGARLNHIMIDEFQDTSAVQWHNFKVLLKECIDHRQDPTLLGSLIVGDVKQSIYRWRNGDWRLLNNIVDEFGGGEEIVKDFKLKTNRRSDKRIVDFNNHFFAEALQYELNKLPEEDERGREQMKKAYDDLKQQTPEDKQEEGYVRVELLPQQDYEEETLERLAQDIQEVIDRGARPSDIAILLRSNREIKLIASYFMNNYPHLLLVSDDAFQLDSSSAVCIIVDAMRLLSQPDDKITKAQLLTNWMFNVKKSVIDESECLRRDIDMDSLLPGEFVKHFEELRTLPITDLADRIYKIFDLQELPNEDAFIFAFHDIMSAFAQDKLADINLFLEEWDNNLYKQTISSDSVDGIRIITIHKSKGLEFDTVFLPFCDWRMTENATIWCKPEGKILDEMPVIPIRLSQKMLDSVYKDEYTEENLQNAVDNLNLLYVAFTRPKKNLIVYGKMKGGDASRSAVIAHCIPQIQKLLTGSRLETIEEEKKEALVFEHGTLNINPHTSDEKEGEKKDDENKVENVFTKRSKTLFIENHSTNFTPSYRQSNESRRFVLGEDGEQPQNEYMKLGSILHYIFSTIATKDDIPKALKQLEQEGILYNENINGEKLIKLLHDRLSDKKVEEWFSPKWQLYNECTILYYDSDEKKIVERRPDRVMINGNKVIVVDFKFAVPDDDHKNQVCKYMELISEMGDYEVEGYLWYVYTNKIEKV